MTAFIYLIGVDGKYLGFLPPNTDAERIAETIRPYLGRR
jgi:protein SCO1/2